MAVIQTPQGGMSVRKPSGYEVPPDPITGKGGYSTIKPTISDILRGKPIYSSGNSGGTSGGVTTSQDLEAQAKAQEQAKQEAERQRIESERQQSIQEAKKEYNRNVRNIQGITEKQQAQRDLNLKIADIYRQERQQKASQGITPKTDVQRTREYSEQARTIREEATKRGIDISTPVQERRFISQLDLKKSQITSPAIVSESIYRDIERKASQGNVEAQNLFSRIKQSGGGYVILPEEVRPSVKKASSIFSLYKETSPLMTSPISKIKDVYDTLTKEQKEKIITTSGNILGFTTMPYKIGNIFLKKGYEQIPETVKEKLISATPNIINFNLMPYTTLTKLAVKGYQEIPEETKQRIITGSKDIFFQQVKTSPAIKIIEAIRRIPKKKELALVGFQLFKEEVKKSPIVKLTPTLLRTGLRTGLIGVYPQVSGAEVLRYGTKYGSQFIQSPFFSYQQVSGYNMLKYSAPVVSQLGYPQLTPQDIFFGLKTSAPYIKKGIEKATPYISKALSYTRFLGYPQISPRDIYTGIKVTAPYSKYLGYPQINIGGRVLGIYQAREKEYYELEPKGKEILKQINELQTADYETQQKLIKNLESKGVKFERQFDYFTGKSKDMIVYPNWMQGLREEFETKTQKETFIPFFVRKLKTGISETTSELYQRGLFKGATLLEPSKPVIIGRTARELGQITAGAYELGLYAVPYVGTGMFLGGTAEALARRKGFIKFAREEPFQVISAGAYGGLQIGSRLFGKPIQKYGKKAIDKTLGYFGLEIVKKPTTITKIVKPKVSVSASLDDSLYRGKDVLGRDIYTSEGKILSRVRYPSKRVYEVKTDILGKVLATPLDEGVIKFESETLASSIKSGAIKTFKDKVTGNIYLYSAETKGSLQPSLIEDLFTGTSTSKIKDVGRIKIITTPEGTGINLITKRKPKEFEAISNIKSKILKTEPSFKTFGDKIKLTIQGERTTAKSITLTDIYGLGNIPDRDLGLGLSSVFKPTPPEEAIKIFKGGQKLVTKTPPLSSVLKEDVNILSAVIKKDLEKPIKIITTIQPEIKALPSLSPALAPVSLLEQTPRIQEKTISRFADQTKTIFGDLGVATTRFGLGEESRTKEKIKLREQEQEQLKDLMGLSSISSLSTSTKEKQAQKERQALKSKLSQQQRQETAQALKLLQVQRTQQQTKQPQKPFKPLIPIIKLPSSQVQRLAKKVSEEPDIFSIFVTKAGKEIEIGKAKTKTEAERILQKELFGTLRAGGGIKFGGEKIKAKEIRLGLGFKESKIDPFKVIEFKERRLKKGTQEIPEIMSFKRKTKRKSNSLLI